MISSPNTRDGGWIRVWGGRRHGVRRGQRLTKSPTWQADEGWVPGWRAGLRHSKGWGKTVLYDRISQVLIIKKVKKKNTKPNVINEQVKRQVTEQNVKIIPIFEKYFPLYAIQSGANEYVRVCKYTCSTFSEYEFCMILWWVQSRVYGIKRNFALAGPSVWKAPFPVIQGTLAVFIQGTVPVALI